MASNTKASNNIENAQYNGVGVMLHKVEHSILQKRFRSCSKLTIQVGPSPATLHMHRASLLSYGPHSIS